MGREGKKDPSERKREFRLQWEQCHVTEGRRQMTGDLRDTGAVI